MPVTKHIPRANRAAAAAPTADDDITLGYSVGSQWQDTTNDVTYVCVDNADGAAVWVPTGFVQSGARAYLAGTQVIPTAVNTKLMLETEGFDLAGEFDSSVTSGTADATEANKLHDADGGFTADMVGATVWNTTDETYTTVSAFVDSGELTLADDIMADTETYNIYFARFTAAAAGKYAATVTCELTSLSDGVTIGAKIYVNGACAAETIVAIGAAMSPRVCVTDVLELSAADYVEAFIYHNHGSNRNALSSAAYNFMSVIKLGT
jgi:hypothetical protein